MALVALCVTWAQTAPGTARRANADPAPLALQTTDAENADARKARNQIRELDEGEGASQVAAAAAGRASIAFNFEPMFTNIDQNDETLRAYGFQPVGTPLLLTYGLRARFESPGGWFLGGAISYGFALSQDEGSPVPTTTSLVTMAMTGGRRLTSWGLYASMDVGFDALTHAVGSDLQGGALVYLGPMVHPRLVYNPLSEPFLEFGLGYHVHMPLGAAHDVPLWEDGFGRTLIHGITLSVRSGFSKETR